MATENRQIKSKERVSAHGEVFTAEREVNAMLDLVKDEAARLESRFLEPACGTGNFLIEILRRKLAVVDERHRASRTDWEFHAAIALSGIYGVELLEDNAAACRDRLMDFFLESYKPHAAGRFDLQSPFLQSMRFLLERNIVCGDALTYTTSTGVPIVFSEWTPIEGAMLFGRCDFQYNFLVTQEHQYSLFDEQGEVQRFDDPICSFPPRHYTKLYLPYE